MNQSKPTAEQAAEVALQAYDELYRSPSTGEYIIDGDEAQVAADLAAVVRGLQQELHTIDMMAEQAAYEQGLEDRPVIDAAVEAVKGSKSAEEIVRRHLEDFGARLTTEPHQDYLAALTGTMLAAVEEALPGERREAKHYAWIEGYEACKRGEQMHSPYRGETS